MRRRAMSHNKYRTPARIRGKIKEEEINLKRASKCRKHLRKSKVLLISYKKRQRNSKWLETHLWHSKRMKMFSYYSYRVPE
jgi:ribonuclease P/MRP protein subunit POP1